MNHKKFEDEIEFKELLKKPIRLFGWVYVYFFVAIVGLGLYYILNLDSITIHQGPYLAKDSSNLKRNVEMKKGGVIPAADLSKLRTPSDSLVNAGEELYAQNCQSCHGDDGQGNGPASQGLNPAPRNFSSPENWVNGRTIDEMYKTLEEGISGSAMASYEYLPVGDKFAIIHYVRTFSDFPEITEEQISQLDRDYKLSEGKVSANQIPVALAMQKLREESGKFDFDTEDLLTRIPDSSAGKNLFTEITLDKKRAVVSFIASDMKNNFTKFKSSVLAAPVDLGYKAQVVNLSDEELQELFNFIKVVENSVTNKEKRSV